MFVHIIDHNYFTNGSTQNKIKYLTNLTKKIEITSIHYNISINSSIMED